jgi:stalled ribosome alternative rescue factor ArfA
MEFNHVTPDKILTLTLQNLTPRLRVAPSSVKMHDILVSYLQSDIKKNRERWLRIDYCNHLLVVITELWGIYVKETETKLWQELWKITNLVDLAKSYVKRAHLVAVIEDVLYPGKKTKCQKNKESLKRLMKPDWREFYLDDGYDPVTAEFTSMSLESEKEYNDDKKRFTLIFIDDSKEETKDSNRTKIDTYAENVRNMWFDRNQRREILRQMTDSVFEKHVSDADIMKRIEATRQQILAMFVSCEEYYARGLNLYEAIVESLILKTTQRQIQYLENLRKTEQF